MTERQPHAAAVFDVQEGLPHTVLRNH